jgi:AcrR family transcriptional regulator
MLAAMEAAAGSRAKQDGSTRPRALKQRKRILAAVAEVVSKRGYQASSVELIAERAGMTKKTFYAYFPNREEALLACLDGAAEEARRRILEAMAGRDEWPEQIRAGLATFLDYVAAEPALARTCLVETMGAGTRALDRYENALRSFTPLLRGGREQRQGAAPLPDILEDTLVGGVVWMIHQRLLRGEAAEVPALLPRMLKFVYTPYLGEARARELAGVESAAPPPDAPIRLPKPAVASRLEPGDGVIAERQVRMTRLPGGRGLDPQLVARDQRRRILAAMVECVAERGYNETTIVAVITAASVSRQTFYELFTDKEECFLAAYDAVVARVDRIVLEATATETEWPRQVAAAITALLSFFGAHPDMARLCLLEAAAMGEGSIERREQDAARFDALIAIGRTQLGDEHEQPEAGAEEALFGGLTTLLTRRVIAGEAEQLDGDAPDLIEFILTPFIGVEEAHATAVGYAPATAPGP